MRLTRSFFERDVLVVAPELIGKMLARRNMDSVSYYSITEVEAYRGTEDKASHARFGRTSRNGVMFQQGGLVYIYLIYGMYWMLNFVTGPVGQPQAILLRGLDGLAGPGRITRALAIDKSFYGEDLIYSGRIWIEDRARRPEIVQRPRFGIDYAGEPWKSMPWRFIKAEPPEIV
jgi:DNA-3-methyladenine glycosylase